LRASEQEGDLHGHVAGEHQIKHRLPQAEFVFDEAFDAEFCPVARGPRCLESGK
jgi:hypothetical protein